MKTHEIREVIKNLQTIEALIDIRPTLAKDRLYLLIEDLQKEAKRSENVL